MRKLWYINHIFNIVILVTLTRWHSTEDELVSYVKEWNDFERQLTNFITFHLPKGWIKSGEKSVELSYSILKSDGKLERTQEWHCDSKNAWHYQQGSGTSSNVKFPMSLLVGIESLSFLDYISVTTNGTDVPQRIAIQRGDVLLLRGDVPHRGVENVAEHEHYRLHVYVDPAGIKKKDVIAKDTTIPVDINTSGATGPYVYDEVCAKWLRRNTNEDLSAGVSTS